MVLSAEGTRRLLKLLKGSSHLKNWRLLLVLICFFVIGYLISLAFSISNKIEILVMLTGVIFFLGALFVLVTVRLGQRTIVDLLNTTVSKTYVENILRAIPDMVIVANRSGEILSVNRAAVQVCEYAEKDLVGQKLTLIFPAFQVGFLDRVHPTANTETRLKTRNNHHIPVSLSIATLTPDKSDPANFVFLAKNIAEQKIVEARLEHEASHDPLTGLPNRALLIDRLELEIERVGQDSRKSYGVLFIDLDYFKNINDRYGRIVGDQVLMAVARRLEHSTREEDLVSRLGDDEFVILLSRISATQDVELMADRILRSLGEPYEIMEEEIQLTGSIGYLTGSSGTSNATDVLRDVDQALYQAKAAGRARAREFGRF